MEGQANLRDAVRRSISFRDPKSGKTYQLKQQVPLGSHSSTVPEGHGVVCKTAVYDWCTTLACGF